MSYGTAHGDWKIPARSSEGKARAYLHQLEAGWGIIQVTESDAQRDPLTLTRIGMDPTQNSVLAASPQRQARIAV